MGRDYEITKEEQAEINKFSKTNSAYKDIKAKIDILNEEAEQVNDALDMVIMESE
jgi:hypothetical protein